MSSRQSRPARRSLLHRLALLLSLPALLAALPAWHLAAAPEAAPAVDPPARPAASSENCVIAPAEMLAAIERGGELRERQGLLRAAPGNGSWQDGLFLLPWTYGGSYDRDLAGVPNVDPRQWVAQSFFAANPDQYDFLLVLTNFDWNAGALTRGLYWSIENNVTGIGIAPVDLSVQFGSQRLQGYIDGMNLRGYRLADGSLDQQRVREILNHELGHRWLVHPHFDSGSGDSNALLGRDLAHWSYLLDSDASFLYGSDWTANGDGTYTATAIRKRFSALDLYLMGMISPADVAPLTLLVNPAIDVTQIPLLGDTVTATPQPVTIDDIIAAEGPRSPDFGAAQKEFRIGVVYLYDPAQGLYNQDLDLARQLKSFWQKSFFLETRGRGVVDASERPRPTTSALVDLARALSWLASRTTGDLWSDSALTVARDSAETIEALGRAGGYQGKVEAGLEALPTAAAESGELRLRRLEALARWGSNSAAINTALAEALAAQEPAGGFAALPRYSPDHLTSARGVRALAAAGRSAQATAAWNWLKSRQNADGGWSWQEGGNSSVAATIEVALAARVLDPHGYFARPEVVKAYNYLLGKRVGGGLGDLEPNVAQTALFVLFVLDQQIDQSIVQQAVDFLASSQRADGSWEGSVYKTALATAALQTFLLPDPFVDPGEVLANPADPFEDESTHLLAAVRNGGTLLAAGTEYAFQILPRGGSSPLLILSGNLPELADTGFYTVDLELAPGQLGAGDYDLRFVIDPNRRISEKTRDNNVVTLPFKLRSHPAGVDLEIRRDNLQAAPDEITAMPQPLIFGGSVRNLGLTPALGVRVVAFDGDPRQGIVLGETSVDVPALGSAVFSIEIELLGARPHEVFAVADPDVLTGDADTINNRASKLILLRLTTDLEILPGNFTAEPASGEVGTLRNLYLTVHNGGTSTVENFQVAFRYTDGVGDYLIRQLTVPGPLAPDQFVDIETTFTPNLDGLLTLTATIDPQHTLGDVELADNVAQIPLTVGSNSLPNLHLELGGITTVPSPPLQGQNATVKVTISNPTRNAAPAFLARLWLDAIGSGTPLAETTFPGLAGQASVELTANWNVTEPQNHKIYAEVDPAGQIAELDEEDNQSFVVADVQTLPDLALSSGSIGLTPDFPRAGDSLHFAVEILNQGDQPSLATQLELRAADGILLASVPTPALAGHQRITLGLDWTPPGGPGDYDLLARVNNPSAFPETEIVNNQASFSVALQDGNLYVSNQIFSPNGDGIKDSATFFFRLPASAIEIVDRDGEVLRTLATDGGQSVLWDGRSNRGLLARDGVYKARLSGIAEAVETWVAVDNNLTGISQDVKQRLLVGFLEPQLPGGGYPERSYFNSMIVNPVVEEIYAVEKYENWQTEQQTWTLRRFDGEEMVEIGDYPPHDRPLIGVDATGSHFLAGDFWDYAFDLVSYPGPEVDQVYSPGEGGYRPYLSPDGRWLAWIERWNANEITLENIATGDRYNFSSADQGLYGGCGYTVNWTRNNQLVVSVGRWGNEGFYYHLDTATEPPTGEVLLAEESFGVCGGGDLTAQSTAAPAQAGPDSVRQRTNVGFYNTNFGGSVDLEKGTLTWVLPSGGGGVLTAAELAGRTATGGVAGGDIGSDFWHAASAGFYGAEGLAVGRYRLADGGELSQVAVDLGPVNIWSTPPLALSNDGDALAIYLGGGEAVRGGSATSAAAFKASGLLAAAPPEILAQAKALELGDWDAETPAATIPLSSERLIDWRHGEQRGLPFRLGDALFTSADKYLVANLSEAWQNNDLVPYFSPAANLTTRLRPRILFGDAGVDLWVLATDAYLDYYRLDYASLDDPSLTFHPIGLPSDEPLFGERWGTWLPPGNGRYRVRLEALDRAGNLRTSSKRVVWNGDNDIANLYLDHRYVSPRSSPGVKDELTFHYTVLRPANLRFGIEDQDGNVVGQIEVAADVIGPRTTTFAGNDGVGNPLPDGAYLLTYGEASWPFVIDNTPPEVVLTIGPTRLLAQKPDRNGTVRADLLGNEIFAAVRDTNLENWNYEQRGGSFPDWLVVENGTSEFERDGERAWKAVGAASLVRRELRMRAVDLAGNETITARSHREEMLRFAQSEPICRSSLPPCVYPQRPALADLGDNGGRLEAPAHVLDPNYDTVLVQSTVWTDALALSLEYRPISLTGLPTGPWQTGAIEVKSIPVGRLICTTETSAKDPDAQCYEVRDGLRAVYWNHPSLVLQPQQVRLAAQNVDGQVVYSPTVDYYPAVPLYLEHVGVFKDGDHVRVTNISSAPVRSINLALRVATASGVTWQGLVSLSSQLRPGEFVTVATGCVLLPLGGNQVRAQGIGALGEDAVSLPIVVPDREGYSQLATSFAPATCVAGNEANVSVSSTAARGFASDAHKNPCNFPPPPFPGFWTGRGDQPITASGYVPKDPAGVPFTKYELLVDGAPFLTLTGPFDNKAWTESIDFSSLGEGSYTLTERFSYNVGQEGMLEVCPQDLALTIDRTPPQLQIDEPGNGDYICPSDLLMPVDLGGNDASAVTEKVMINGVVRAGSPTCSPYAAIGGAYSIEANTIPAGLPWVSAMAVDLAGNATCVPVQVAVPELPKVSLSRSPALFSPINLLGRPTTVEAKFTTRSPGYWEADIRSAGGSLVQILPPTPTDGAIQHFISWDGRDVAAALLPDGFYHLAVTATSPCGAQHSARVSVELDATPPEAILSAPTAGAVLGSVVEWKGLARDLHFESYALQIIGVDVPPNDWTTVASGTRATETVEASLGTWRTDAYPAGQYQVRLLVTDRPGNQGTSAEIPVRIRERHFIKRFERDPALFSPNGDSQLDLLAIRFELIQDAKVTLEVRDENDVRVVRLIDQLVQTGVVEHLINWDGHADLGGRAADGTYKLVLLAEDPETPATLTSEEEELSATVDTVPPVLGIESPLELSLSGLPLPIVGSLEEIHPDRYSLKIESVATGPFEAAAGPGAFASRQLTELEGQPDGDYFATFSASDAAANSASLLRHFRIDNTAPAVVILAPTTGEIRDTTADYLTLTGEITEDNLLEWAFSYAPGEAPDDADFIDITRQTAPANGTLPDGDVTFNWDASRLADGPYTLRLEASDAVGRTVETRILLIVDNTPPEVEILDPQDGAILAEPRDVIGSALDANLRTWQLSLRRSGDSEIQLLGQDVEEVDSDLLAPWSVLPVDGDYELILKADDRAGHQSETTIEVSVTTEPLAPPVLLSATVQNLRDVALLWQPGPGPTPAAYHVYRNGVRITDPQIDQLDWLDSGRADGVYSYTVRAVAGNGTETADSNALEVTISNGLPVARIAAPVDGARISDLFEVKGTAWRDGGFQDWQLWVRPEAGSWQLIGSGTAPVLADYLATWDTALPQYPDGVYQLRLDARDLFSHSASHSITVEVDNTEPVAPVLTNAFSQAQDPDAEVNDIHLDWTLTPTPADLAGFYLYRNGQLANAPGPVVGTTTPFLIAGLAYDDRNLPDGTYTYFVTAADEAGNESAASNLSPPIVIDTRRPHAVIVDPANGSEFEESVVLTAETPDLDVVSLRFEYRAVGSPDWITLATLSTPPFKAPFAPGATGPYEVRPVAADGVGEDPAPEAIVITATDLPPGAPAALSLRVDGGTIHLSWQAAADPHHDLAGYHVYRDGAKITTDVLPKTQLTYDDTGLADAYYNYEIHAVDAAGHEGESSPTRQGEVVSPVWYWTPPVLAQSVTELSGNTPTYNDVVELYRKNSVGDYVLVATQTDGDSSFAGVPLEVGFNTFALRGKNTAGDRTKQSKDFVVLRHPLPATPASFTATVAAPNVDLTWSPVVDPDLVGYDLARSSTSLGLSSSPLLYDSGTHNLSANFGALSDWQRMVDGDPGTFWAPPMTDAYVNEIVFEWRFDSPRYLGNLQVRTPAPAYRMRVEAQMASGEWLWLFEAYSYSTFLDFGIGIEAQALRVVWPRYECYNCRIAELALSTEARVATASYSDLGVANGAAPYSVASHNRYGQISPERDTLALVGVDAPAPPRNLTATADGCGTIAVAWQPPATLPAIHRGYRLYRSVAGGAFQAIADLPPATTFFDDTSLADGTSFSYRATTLAEISGMVVESQPSNEAAATTTCLDPPAPVLLEPTTAGSPILWPQPLADVGGRGWPGSQITLRHDGNTIATLQLEPVGAEQSFDLPDFAQDLRVEGGRWAIYVADQGSTWQVTRYDLQNATSTAVPAANPNDPTLSPDGQRAVYADEVGGQTDLYLYDFTTAALTRLTNDASWESRPLFLPDGRSLIFLSHDDTDRLRRLDIPSLSVTTLISSGSPELEDFSLSESGTKAIVRTWQGPWIVDTASGDQQQPYWWTTPGLSPSAFSPSGNKVVFVMPDWGIDWAQLYVADLITGEVDAISPVNGEFGATFLDEGTLVFWQRTGPFTLRLLQRSLFDGQEKVLLDGVDIDDVRYYDQTPIFREGESVTWALRGSQLLRLQQPSGQFVVPGITLHAGANFFDASQLFGGATQVAEAIEVDVDPNLFGDAVAVAVEVAPSFPVAGQQVVVQGAYRNDGPADLYGLEASLLRIAPTGASEVVAFATVDLPAFETRRLRYTFDTTGLTGDYLFRLELDPAGKIIESDEQNNRATKTLPVRTTLGLEATVSTDHATYVVRDPVLVAGHLASNAPPALTAVSIAIETASGEAVASLASYELEDFTGSQDFSSRWDTTGFLPGAYRAHLVARQAGVVVAQATAAFTLEPHLELTLAATADKTFYVRGATANFLAKVRNIGDSTVQNAVLHLIVEPMPTGSAAATQERRISALSVGDLRSFSWAWPAEAEPGAYDLRAVLLSSSGAILAEAEPYAFVIGPVGAALGGDLQVVANATEPGGALTVSAQVQNNGDVAIIGGSVRVEVINPKTGALVDTFTSPADFPIGGTVARSWPYSPAMRELQPFIGILSALDATGEPQQLDTATFEIVDLTPPTLEWLGRDSFSCSAILPLRVRALDSFSQVVEVNYQVDAGQLKLPLLLETVQDTVWISFLFADPARTTPYHLTFHAQDGAGNPALPLEVDFLPTIDEEAPILTVAAPAEASCVPAPASATFSAADANLTRLEAWLDGVAYTSGTPIADGPHELRIQAEDGCGRITEEIRRFTVDSAPPALTVVAPVEASCNLPPVAVTFSATDSNLLSTSATLDGAPYLSGTPITGEGPHVFVFEATDSCGNLSRETRNFTVDSAPPVLTVTAPAEASCVAAPASVTFSASDANLGTVTATLDGAPYLSGTPITSEGAHTFVLEATDGCGNLAREMRHFTIDSAPPVLTVTAPAEASCNLPPAVVTFSASDPNLGTVTATLDGAPYLSGTPITGEGPHVFVLEATDSCGNLSRETRNFTVDSAAPVLSLTAPAEASCSSPPAVVTFSASDPNLTTTTATLNGAPYLSGTPIAVEGPYLLVLEARDSCANTSRDSRSFMVDAGPPTVSIAGPAQGSCVPGPTFATFTVNDPNPRFVNGLLDGQPYSSGAPITDGQHHLLAIGEDKCGNSAQAERDFLVDSVAPVVLFSGAVDGGVYDPPLTISFAVTDPNLTSQTATLDGTAVSSPFEVSLPGPHLLVVSGSDCAGNVHQEALHFTIRGGEGTLVLTGELSLPLRVLHTEPLPVMAELRNQSAQAVNGATYRVRLVDPADASVLAEETITLDLAAGAATLLDYRFATDQLMPGIYRVELRAAGSYAGLPFDLELDRADVEVLPLAVDVPVDPVALLLLSLLLATAGWLSLRRFSPFPKGSNMRRLMVLLFVSLLVSALPARADQLSAGCGEHFPELRKALAAAATGAAPAVLPRSAGPSLARELAIEKALWQDELDRRGAELDELGLAAATERLRELAAVKTEQFAAIERSLGQGQALPADLQEKLKGCGEGDSRSAEIVARGLELPHREARLTAAPPAGYLDPPNADLRSRLLSARQLKAKAGGEVLTKALSDDELVAKAGELGNDPVRIYRYVVEKIRPAYYFGAMRAPEATLRAGEGNDADQAALLAGLLRAADLPARVVWGTVEIEVADLLDHWSARDTAELERLMTAAGVPWSPVAVAGRVGAYRVERAWCEVYLPYANFRGVVLDDSGRTWLGLDPQIKPRLGRATVSVLDQLGTDGAAFVSSYLAGDACEAPLERAGACSLPSTLIRQQVDDLLGDGSWESRTAAPVLPPQAEATLPAGRIGVVRSVAGFGIDFPDSFRHRVRLRARAGSRTLLDVTVGASEIAGREAGLWFTPATTHDQALANGYGDLWLVPPYLVDVKLQLWVDGEELALGNGAIGMGEPFDLEITLTTPDGDSRSFKNSELAGVPIGFGLAPGRGAYRPLGGQAANTPEVLAQLATNWLDATADFGERLARLEGLPVVHPFPTFATVGSVVVPLGSAGLVERLDWRGIYVDADLFGARVLGSAAAESRWLRLAGLEASAQERALFERYGMASVSADLLVALAQARGVTVHQITAANLGAILPTLPFSAAIKAEIDGWVRAGGSALVPAAALDFVEFHGVGYILQDNETGEARYQLSGSLSGGMIAVPPFEVVPGVAQPLQVPQNGFINTFGDDAVSIKLHDGNLQIGTVGKTLGAESGTLPLRVIVRDRDGRLVSNANVIFTVLAGGGKVEGSTTATVQSIGGVATAKLTLGQKTDKNPYYLLFPNETWAQRADLTIVKAEVNGYGMNDLFYEFGRPDEVTQLLTPYGSSLQGWPHLSAGTPVLVRPADQYQNPVANQDVTFSLSASPPSAGKGPELLSVNQRASCGGTTMVMAGECGGTGSVTDKGSITGVWTYLILGEDDSYTVTATASGGSNPTTTITGNVIKWVPTGSSVGWPTVLIAGRSQPAGPSGSGTSEAYKPGKASLPLKVSLFVIHETYSVVSCSGSHWCTQPEGKYKTRRLATTPIAGCFPDSCGGGQITESATIQFNGDGGISGSQSNPVSAGVYEQAVTMPANPGRYAVRAKPTAKVSVPKKPANPVAANEIVPCNSGGCGAVLELKDLSDPDWYVEFVLWAVRGKIDGMPPVVKLGHENRHETDTEFPYLIEPADYPALGVGVAFIEDGTIPLLARADGRGPGTATLPVGKIFEKPEGKHELMVLINPGWVWQPTAGQPTSMMIEGDKVPFSVVQFDVDVDSDNNNGIKPPDRNDAEENIEEDGGPTKLGKLIFVNHDNDDAESDDDRPDYVELTAIAKEDNMIPVEIELRPEQGNYGSAQLIFDYDGPAAGSLPDGNGTSLGSKRIDPTTYNYYNYEAKKLATYRLWKIDAQTAARSASEYLAPNTSYPAGSLGFSSGTTRKTFWLEAINGKALSGELMAKDIKVKLTFSGQDVEEKVRLTPIEANLGFNNSNGYPSYMRPGVPDGPLWTIDNYDEQVEDQGNGFAFWVAGDVNAITKHTIEDLAPFIVDLPKRLIDDKWEFALQLVDPSRRVNIETYRVDRADVKFLNHVSLQPRAEQLLGGQLDYSDMVQVDYIERKIELASEQAAFLMRVSPNGFDGGIDAAPKIVRMNLLVRDPKASDWISVDSVKLELKPFKKFFSWWTARNGPKSTPISLPTECHPTTACDINPLNLKVQNTLGYAPVSHIDGSARLEPEVKPYFVFVHGYAVDYPNDALKAASKVFKRSYWQGYRGNMVAVTWEGDDGDPLFSPNVDHAFRTSPLVRDWIEGVLQAPPYSAQPSNITFMAHSLGNQVMFDTMRLHAIKRKTEGKGLLFAHMIAVEPAVWGETFWPQQPVSYSLPSVPTTYSEDDLRWSSWAFWFNQRAHPAATAVSTVTHSWAPADYALTGMRIDDCLVRNPGLHFLRGLGSSIWWRVPVEDSWGMLDDLTSSKAAMMALRVPEILGCTNFLVPPAGQAPNLSATNNIDAGTFGWGAFSHSAFAEYPAYEIYLWYYNALRGRVPMGQDKF